jgi:hypothetical protein
MVTSHCNGACRERGLHWSLRDPRTRRTRFGGRKLGMFGAVENRIAHWHQEGVGWWIARRWRKVIMRVQNCSVARALACTLPPSPWSVKNGKYGGKPK